LEKRTSDIRTTPIVSFPIELIKLAFASAIDEEITLLAAIFVELKFVEQKK